MTINVERELEIIVEQKKPSQQFLPQSFPALRVVVPLVLCVLRLESLVTQLVPEKNGYLLSLHDKRPRRC